MNMDYKQQDTLRILDYLRQYPDGVSVDDIIEHSDANRLRVYPALFELEQEGRLEVLEREVLGAARVVRLIVSDIGTKKLKIENEE